MFNKCAECPCSNCFHSGMECHFPSPPTPHRRPPPAPSSPELSVPNTSYADLEMSSVALKPPLIILMVECGTLGLYLDSCVVRGIFPLDFFDLVYCPHYQKKSENLRHCQSKGLKVCKTRIVYILFVPATS